MLRREDKKRWRGRVASCYRNQDKLQPQGPPWLVCDFTLPYIKTIISFPLIPVKILINLQKLYLCCVFCFIYSFFSFGKPLG